MDRLERLVVAVAVTAVLAAAVGCEQTTPDPEQAVAVETTVERYLDALSESYTNLDVQPLEEWASPNEVARVRNLLQSLVQTGDRVESTLRGYQIDHLEMFREINATVRLIEVWDVVRYNAFTGEEKGRTSDSIQKSVLQLRLVDDRWIVIGRTVLERETPVADAPGDGG
jgi:hypothetical protein